MNKTKNEKKISIKQYLEDEYSAINLSQSQLKGLKYLQKKYSQKEKKHLDKPWLGYLNLAASIVVMLSVLALWNKTALTEGLFNTPVLSEFNTSTVTIAQEVLKNHYKQEALKIKSDAFSELQQFFSKLDFTLQTLPNELNEWKIIGGLYCSVQGQKAAQLRLRHKKTGRIETLYQAPNQNNVFSALGIPKEVKKAKEQKISNGQVKIWQQQDVLFIFTQTPQ